MDKPALSRRRRHRLPRTRAQLPTLQALLDAGGWSVPSLARASGLSPNTIYSAVRGDRQPWDQTIETLAAALGVTTGEVRRAWATGAKRRRR